MTEQIESTQIRQKTIVQQVMERIKDFVSSGEIVPGDRLPTELELAKSFGVSRSSIREAIKIFSYLGVFDTQTRRGTVLCDHSNISNEALTWTFLLGKKDFGDLLELRKAIEQEAWMILCEEHKKNKTSTQPTVDRLAREVDTMKQAIKAKDIVMLEEADYHFHEAVIESSRNEQFLILFQTLKAFTLEEIRKSNIYRNLSPFIHREHLQLLKALEADDLEKVIQLFRAHIKTTKKNVEAGVYAAKAKTETAKQI